MQRSLLPQVRPAVEGLDIGEVYARRRASTIGGDLYDYIALADGRLAVVLGDVTGHGVDAAADMAMAKFVFRSLVREHPEPSDFLAAANEVVVGEIAPGKFITMLYLLIDPTTGRGRVRVRRTSAAAARRPRRDGRRHRGARARARGRAGVTYDEVARGLEPGARSSCTRTA